LTREFLDVHVVLPSGDFVGQFSEFDRRSFLSQVVQYEPAPGATEEIEHDVLR
jgi:hypothetical protein